jgi:hypothetical protein
MGVFLSPATFSHLTPAPCRKNEGYLSAWRTPSGQKRDFLSFFWEKRIPVSNERLFASPDEVTFDSVQKYSNGVWFRLAYSLSSSKYETTGKITQSHF